MIDTNTEEYKRRQQQFIQQNQWAYNLNTSKNIQQQPTQQPTQQSTQQQTQQYTQQPTQQSTRQYTQQPTQQSTQQQTQQYTQQPTQQQTQPQYSTSSNIYERIPYNLNLYQQFTGASLEDVYNWGIQNKQKGSIEYQLVADWYNKQREAQNISQQQKQNDIIKQLDNYVNQGKSIDEAKNLIISGKPSNSTEYQEAINWYNAKKNTELQLEATRVINELNPFFIDKYNPVGFSDPNRWRNEYIQLRNKGYNEAQAKQEVFNQARVAREEVNKYKAQVEVEKLNADSKLTMQILDNLKQVREAGRTDYFSDITQQSIKIYQDLSEFNNLLNSNPNEAKDLLNKFIINFFSGSLTSSMEEAYNRITNSIKQEYGGDIMTAKEDALKVYEKIKTYQRDLEGIENEIRRDFAGQPEYVIQALIAERTQRIKKDYKLATDTLDVLNQRTNNIIEETKLRLNNYQIDYNNKVNLVKDFAPYIEKIIQGQIEETPENIVKKINDYIIGGLNAFPYWEQRAIELKKKGYSKDSIEGILLTEMKEKRQQAGEVLFYARNKLEEDILRDYMQKQGVATNSEEMTTAMKNFKFLRNIGMSTEQALIGAGLAKEDAFMLFTPQEKSKMELELQKTILSDSTYTTLSKMQAQFTMIKTAWENYKENVKNGADIQAEMSSIITTFLKILDPNSVVMLGEFAREASLQSDIQQMINRFKGLYKGGSKIDPVALEGYYKLSEKFITTAIKNAKEALSGYKNYVETYGLNEQIALPPVLRDDTDNQLRKLLFNSK